MGEGHQVTLYLDIDGRRLPLAVTDAGIALEADVSSSLFALRWIDSMNQQGRVPDLEAAVAEGRDFTSEVVAIMPIPTSELSTTELAEVEDEWAAHADTELGTDVLSIGSPFLRCGLILPRPALAKFLSSLQVLRRVSAQDEQSLLAATDEGKIRLPLGVALRAEPVTASEAEPAPPWSWTASLSASEHAHLAVLDANADLLREILQSGTPDAIEAVRVGLLREMEAIGLASTEAAEDRDEHLKESEYSSLWLYYRAVQSAVQYYASEAREAANLGPAPSDPCRGPISLDWFVNETFPPPGFTPHVFIASIEAAFRAISVKEPHGELTLEVPAGTYDVRWRTENGLRALVSADRHPDPPKRYAGPSREDLGLAEAPTECTEAVLNELEQRARSLAAGDDTTLPARRRFLLLDMQAAGVFDAGANLRETLVRLGHDELLSFHLAALELAAYYRSEERQSWFPSSAEPPLIGGYVALDWFRHEPESPPAGTPNFWLARLELALRGFEKTGDEGYFFFKVYDRCFTVWWYREDGLTPALRRAEAAHESK